ncbi:MAG: sugar phosphate isomerase/epimerase [Armatimonadetes bacterium]|nr:sugar phosphate isomerase/epimerase [Armatimonadota bacterium]
MSKPFADTSRLSLNQYTTHDWTLAEAAEGCFRAGLQWIGLWRDKIAECGLDRAQRLLRHNGLRVSGVCRGGWFPAANSAERQDRIDDNRRAIDECAALSCDTLVLVCGGLGDCSLLEARQYVQDGIAALVDYAADRGVRLGIEPLHPMYAADRSVISTLSQSLDIAEAIGSDQVGVIVDVYHVWWDPELFRQLERARGRIWGYHVNDWLRETNDILMSRGMMGDGVIELRRIREAVEAAGYDGPIECEIFNSDIWASDYDGVLRTMCERYLQYC